MSRNFRTLLLALPVVLAAATVSCTEQDVIDTEKKQDVTDNAGDATYLRINTVSTTELTRAAIQDTKFPTADAASIGIFLEGTSYEDASYKNIKCTKLAGTDTWTTDPQIQLQGADATVYAYYPWQQGTSNIKQVSVASSIDGNDWMWATPVDGVCASKPNVSLSMNHALALVEVTFNLYGYDSGTTITNITLTGKSFSASGTLDATTGALTPGAACDTGSEFANTVSLSQADGKIVADCLLVPTKTGDEAGVRQDLKLSITIGEKRLSASLTGNNGVVVRQGTKSTISLNVKGDKMEVVSVGVDTWTDPQVSGNTATIGGHTVTFNCPEGLKYELRTDAGATAVPGETTEAGEVSTVILRYDISSVPDYRFVFNGSVSGCTFTHDWQDGVITITDLTKDITVDLGYGTYIPYTATAKVVPHDTTAFGFPYDEVRSTFSGGSGVIAIDGEVTTIGYRAIYETDADTKVLTGVTIPEGVTEIGQDAFQHCENLATVTLPEGLKTIGRSAFDYCYNLTIPQFPASLELVDQKAFREAGNNLSKTFSLKLKGKLTEITESTFWNCDNLLEVDMSALTSLAEIGISPFEGCDNLVSITLPSSLRKIGERAFHNCTSLPGIDFAGLVNLTEIGKQAFDGCKALSSVDLGDCTSLNTIKEFGFNGCSQLTSLTLPEGLETIELNAFWHMGIDVSNEAEWKPLELPSTLSTIGQYAFEDSRFTSVTLPAALKTVGTDIFKYSSVRTLTIEDGAVIGRKMFNSCFQLTTVTCKSTTPPNMKADDGLYAIANQDDNTALTNIQNIYVPSSSVEAYQSASGWDMYSGKISAIPSQD